MLKKRFLFDFELNVDFLAGAGKSFGFVFRYKDIFNFYAIELNHEIGYKRLISCIEGKYTILKEKKDGGFSLNYWLNMKIRVKDNELKVLMGVVGSKSKPILFLKNYHIIEFGIGR